MAEKGTATPPVSLNSGKPNSQDETANTSENTVETDGTEGEVEKLVDQTACGGSVELEKGAVEATPSEFLRTIFNDFLNVSEPEQDGLLDQLRACSAITSEDEGEVKAEPTRKCRARIAWWAMNKVPAKLFGDKCLPIIEDLYPHVLKGKKYKIVDPHLMCIRHLIMTHTTAEKFSDIFIPTNSCSAEEYRQIQKHRDAGEGQWMPVFNILKNNHDNKDLQRETQKLLAELDIAEPENFVQLFRDGFPCTCTQFKKPLPPADKPLPKKRTKKPAPARDNASAGSDYPDTVFSSEKVTVRSDTLPSSDGLEKSTCPPPPVTLDAVLQLSPQEKEVYKAALQTVDKALVQVSSVRTEFRKLEAIDGQLTLFREEILSLGLSLEKKIELCKLEGRTLKIRDNLNGLRLCAEKFLRDTQGPGMGFSVKMSSPCLTTLLKRRCLLEKEMNEADYFLRMSQDLIHTLLEQFGKLHLGKTLRSFV